MSGRTGKRATEWIWPVRRGYKMRCCDCGLVHRVDFEIGKRANGQRVVLFRVARDNRSTAQVRRHQRENPPLKIQRKRRKIPIRHRS